MKRDGMPVYSTLTLSGRKRDFTAFRRLRSGAPKGAEPAWRKLERMMEQKRTSELLSDFDDYDVGDRPRPRKGQ